MTYQTCLGCIHGKGSCQARDKVKAHLKGIGVTSIKWKCQHRRPVYQPGDAVWVNLFVGYEERNENWGGSEAEFAEFPGVVISLKRSKAIILVEPGALSECEEYSFEPQKSGNGHVKVSLARTRKRDAVREHICDTCGSIVRLHGHQNGWSCAPRDTWSYA